MNQNQSTIPHLVLSVLMFAIGLFALFTGHGSDTQVAAQVAQLQGQLQTITAQVAGGDQKVGSLAGPDIPSLYLNWGGISHWAFSAQLMSVGAATSTICDIVTPPATTTLSSATLRVDATPYAGTWKIFKGAAQAAQTTLLGSNDLSGTIGAVIATTTATAITDGVLPPNSHIGFFIATTTAVNANFVPTGKCSVTVREI